MNINKTYVAIGGAAVAGLAIGGTAGYFITKKICKKKYQESLDKTISDLSKDYESKIEALKGGTEAVKVEATEEVAEKTEEAPKKEEEKSTDDDEESDGASPKIDYTTFSNRRVNVPDTHINIIGHDDDVITEAEKFVNKIVADEEYPEHNPDGIIKQPRPYLIKIDEFYESQRPWYDQKELILFMKDFIYIDGERVSTPILYSCDDDAIIDVFVDEETSKKLEKAGLVKTGIWTFDNIDLSLDDFGREGYDYKAYEQVKRCDATEIECYIDKRDDKSYAEDLLDIEDVTESNYRDIYRELWQKPEEE